jgi:hypothetical protein
MKREIKERCVCLRKCGKAEKEEEERGKAGNGFQGERIRKHTDADKLFKNAKSPITHVLRTRQTDAT